MTTTVGEMNIAIHVNIEALQLGLDQAKAKSVAAAAEIQGIWSNMGAEVGKTMAGALNVKPFDGLVGSAGAAAEELSAAVGKISAGIGSFGKSRSAFVGGLRIMAKSTAATGKVSIKVASIMRKQWMSVGKAMLKSGLMSAKGTKVSSSGFVRLIKTTGIVAKTLASTVSTTASLTNALSTTSAATNGTGLAMLQAGFQAKGYDLSVKGLNFAQKLAIPTTYAMGAAVKFLTGPVGIILSLATMLIPTIIDFGKSLFGAKENADELGDETADLNDSLDDFEFDLGLDEEIDEIDATVDSIDNLDVALDNLSDKKIEFELSEKASEARDSVEELATDYKTSLMEMLFTSDENIPQLIKHLEELGLSMESTYLKAFDASTVDFGLQLIQEMLDAGLSSEEAAVVFNEYMQKRQGNRVILQGIDDDWSAIYEDGEVTSDEFYQLYNGQRQAETLIDPNYQNIEERQAEIYESITNASSPEEITEYLKLSRENKEQELEEAEKNKQDANISQSKLHGQGYISSNTLLDKREGSVATMDEDKSEAESRHIKNVAAAMKVSPDIMDAMSSGLENIPQLGFRSSITPHYAMLPEFWPEAQPIEFDPNNLNVPLEFPFLKEDNYFDTVKAEISNNLHSTLTDIFVPAGIEVTERSINTFTSSYIEKLKLRVPDLKSATQEDIAKAALEALAEDDVINAFGEPALLAMQAYFSSFDAEAGGQGSGVINLKSSAEAAPQAVIDATEEKKPELEESGATLAETPLNAYDEAAEMKDGESVVAKKKTQVLVDSVNDTLTSEENTELLGSSTKDLINNGIFGVIDDVAEMKGNISHVAYRQGGYIIQGLINGIDSKLKVLQLKMNEAADIITQTIPEEADLGSPSKLLKKQGEFVIQGLEIGVQNRLKPLKDKLLQVSSMFANMVGGSAMPNVGGVQDHRDYRQNFSTTVNVNGGNDPVEWERRVRGLMRQQAAAIAR